MNGQTAQLLVVDDEPEVLSSVALLLRKAGFDVLEARSGTECLQMLEQHHPDLILLDVMLPDIGGVEVLKRIRGNSANDDIFVVHLSAQVASIENKMEGLAHGADGYISQPVENHELLARVRAFLRHKATLDKLRQSESRYRLLFEGNPEPMWVYDRDSLQILAVNNAAIQQYKFSRAEFLSMRVNDLSAGDQAEVFLSGSQPEHQLDAGQLRTKDGASLEVETRQQEILWDGRAARVVLAHDVTERNRVERERVRQLERLAAEYQSLRRLSLNEADEGKLPFERAPEDRARALRPLTVRYEHLLGKAHENRIYKTRESVSNELRDLSKELGALEATARDIIQIHYHTLKKAAPHPGSPKAQAIIETGRMLLIELLGYLVTEYRDQTRPKSATETINARA